MDYNKLIENSVIPIHWEDRDGRILWANQAELDLLGYTAEEYIGHHTADFHVDQNVIADIRSRLLHDETIQNAPARLYCKDDSIKYVLINLSAYKENDHFVHFRCFMHDVSARKEAEELQARLSAVIEYSDDAIVTKTLDGTIVSWNKGASKIFGYSKEEAVGQSIRMLFPPDRLHEEDDFLARISRGEHIDHYETIRVRKDGQHIDISVTLSPIQNASGQIIGASKIAHDITRRKRNERRDSLLLELSTAFSQALTPKQIANVMVEQGIKELGALAGEVGLAVEHNKIEILNYDETANGAGPHRVVPLDSPGPLSDVIRTNSIVWIETQKQYLERYPQLAETIRQSGTHSLVCTPLKVGSQTVGGFCLTFSIEKPHDVEEESFFRTLAHMCALSLERARLYEAEQRERHLAEALRDAVVTLSSTWELPEVLEEILNIIDSVVQHDVADIMLIDDGIARIVYSHRYAERGLAPSEQAMQNFTLKIADSYHMSWVMEHKRPSIIQDTHTEKTWIQIHEPDLIRSTLIVPILIDGIMTGFLNVNRFVPNSFTEKDGIQLQTFADYAAIAIRNTKLYENALQMAAQDERQRIARDLHDSVSQTLFSATITAEILPRLWEKKPEKVPAQIQLLHHLTRNALAEMRVLLIELRPESLVKSNLEELLTQLAYASLGRQDIMFSMVVRGMNQELLPPDVQIAFYRIVQESLNNIIKYGQAKQVRIRFTRQGKTVKLIVTDNGQGFDTKQISGGIGLKSMRERAANINASLDIKSTIGRGTRIKLVWKQ